MKDESIIKQSYANLSVTIDTIGELIGEDESISVYQNRLSVNYTRNEYIYIQQKSSTMQETSCEKAMKVIERWELLGVDGGGGSRWR